MEFTEKYFIEEVTRFREMCGQKDFWAKTEEQRDNMVKGLAVVFLNVQPDGGGPITHTQQELWAHMFDSALLNYNQRKTFMLMHPLKKALGLS